MTPIAIIGFGAIAHAVISSFEQMQGVKLSHLLVRAGRKAEVEDAVGEHIKVICDVAEIEEKPALTVECASHQAVMQFGPDVLRRGLDLAVVSTGALADSAVEQELISAAEQGNSRVHLLAGAVGGIDALASARAAGLKSVVYHSIKPPLAWRGTVAEESFDLSAITTPTVLFEGSARDAARLFPKNANVAATVALAGLGFDQTKVQLTADPQASRNIHTIEADGNFGRMIMEIAGDPLPDNPKTSMLAAYSIVRAVRNLAAPMTI